MPEDIYDSGPAPVAPDDYPEPMDTFRTMPGTASEESFRKQTFPGGYREEPAFLDTGADGHIENPYGQDGYDSYNSYAGQGTYGPDAYGPDAYGPDAYGPDAYRPDAYGEASFQQESYGQEAYEPYAPYGHEPYDGRPDRPATPNPQFEQVYHQPYNYTAPEAEDEVAEYAGEEEYADEQYQDYLSPAIEDEARAAYQADFQRTLAATQHPAEEPAFADERHDLYSQFPPAEDAPSQPDPVIPRRRVQEWTPPPANRPTVSAAPPSFPMPTPAPIPAPRSPRPAAPQRAKVPAARLPLDRIPQRRQAQRRPAPAARGFVPSQDRIGTAREVMTYLARRPWLQLDVVDIILGTQFDRDDVAHALIVLQQTGRISSHLRGDRVCYSYAVT